MATAAASVTPRRRLLPPWITSYQRPWLRPDVIAGLVIWSVVTPQAVAYAQIAGLPPQAGLMAAPGAMAAYALLGTSRQLVVSATTATSALKVPGVLVMRSDGPLLYPNGDAVRQYVFDTARAADPRPAAVVLERAGTAELAALFPTLDAAVDPAEVTSGHPMP